MDPIKTLTESHASSVEEMKQSRRRSKFELDLLPGKISMDLLVILFGAPDVNHLSKSQNAFHQLPSSIFVCVCVLKRSEELNRSVLATPFPSLLLAKMADSLPCGISSSKHNIRWRHETTLVLLQLTCTGFPQ